MPTQPNPLIEIDIGSVAYQVEASSQVLDLTIEEKDDSKTLLSSSQLSLELNKLAGVETSLGQATRLYFLGYLSQLPSTTLSTFQLDSLSIAIATFQEDLGIEATGDADKATQSLLKTIFGA